MVYQIRWWLTGVVARVYSRFLFKDLEIVGLAAHDGPRLVVANHLSGLLDAIVIVRLLGGLPHILAKSTLFEPWPLGLMLRLLGIIPLYRRIDGVDMAKNESSFGAVADVLRKNRTVLIFPEGKVNDDQELQTIRTGAARIALASMAAGAADLSIIPIGITYENKISSRPRVLASVGQHITSHEIRTAGASGEIDETNRSLVDDVTELVTERLGAVSPRYGSFVRERTMMTAAAISLRTGMSDVFSDPKMSDLRVTAQRLSDNVGSPNSDRLVATGRYQLAVTSCGLDDSQIQPRPRTADLARVAFFKGMVVLFLAPIALLGLVANLVAILLVVAAGAVVTKPMSKGTIRAVTGIAAFPLVWTIQILIFDFPYPLISLALMILGLVVLIIGFNQLIDLVEAARDWWSIHNSVALLPELYDLRRFAEDELSEILGRPTAGSR